MKNKKEMIDHMFNSACGYGMGKKAFEKCMNSIPDAYFDDFIYTLYRIADKSGADGFEKY